MTAPPNVATETVLRVEDLVVTFTLGGRVGGQTLRAVDGVSIDVSRGRTLGIVGESGCGKTTTARAIVGLTEPAEGRVMLDGWDLTRMPARTVRRHRKRLQMVFQDPYSSLDPRQTVERVLMEPLDVHGVGTPAERRARVTELLELVGLRDEHRDRYPHQFSGGQRQRIGIARALAAGPDVIVLDEPVSALDVSIQAQIVNLLKDIQDRLGVAYVFIAHDLAVVRHMSHDIAVMYLGRVVEKGPREEIFLRPRHPYTAALLSAVPVPDVDEQTARRRIPLLGEAPGNGQVPTGCRFSPRCWVREALGNPAACTETDPALQATTRPDHVAACHFADQVADLVPQGDETVGRGPA
jgi:peptide/nickel transport system ATP-binding protein/oligopeptide transport system ATP-binding protein